MAGPLDDPAIEALQFARLAPDAESFAYLRNRPSPENGELRTEVVIQRLDESGDFISAEIGSPADMHTSLDFDGRYVIVTARDLLLVFDAQAGPGGELSTQPLIGAEFAYFLDSGIATAGDG